MHRISLFDFIAVAAATLLLAACAGGPFSLASFSTTTPAPTAAQPATAAAAPAGATATLGNMIAALKATVAPAPAAMPTRTVTAREAGAPARISWGDASALMLAGKVTQVTQAHSREVELRLTDGTAVLTVEPALDDVLKLAQSCGGPCAGLLLVTE